VSDRGQARQAKPGRYHEIRRRWTAGDVVELHLPMNVRFVEANPLVEEAKNQVALQRGPLVYCLESTDLPRDTKLNDAVISLTRKPTAVFDAKLLGGVAVLETTLPFPANRTWGTTLYREATVPASRDVTARFIPYFAWANRGPSEMTVWLNRGP
jgi:DUF1680 family protein